MAGHLIQFDRTEKPDASVPLDPNHSLYGRWLRLYDFREGVGDAIDRGSDGVNGTLSGGAAHAVDIAGRGIDCGTTSNARYVDFTTASVADVDSDDFSLFLWFRATNTGSRQRLWAYTVSGGGIFFISLYDNNGSYSSNNLTYYNGSWHTIALPTDRSNLRVAVTKVSGTASVYINGGLAGTFSGAMAGGTPVTPYANRIGTARNGNIPFAGSMYAAGIIQGHLTDAEARQLTANPNLIYEPHRMFVPGAAAVAGGNIPIFYHHYAMLRAY